MAEGATDRAIGTTVRIASIVLGARSRRSPSPAPAPPSAPPSAPAETARRQAPERPAEFPSTGGHGNGSAELASERLEREGVSTTLPSSGMDTSPEHVSEEPELVLETAEPGVEEGAGASVRVLEPWEGFGGMNAQTVISRLSRATAAELTAVQLYERAHRSRRTVLEAAERELRRR